MDELVIATHNPGKVSEISAMLAPLGIKVSSADAYGVSEPAEKTVPEGGTFEGNARIKSEHVARATGKWALADDSGLCVEALDGAPGVDSALWASGKNFTPAMERIHEELAAKGLRPEGRKASFTCVLSLTSPEGKTTTFRGTVDGTLTFPPRGSKGFGYDPIFVPEGHTRTFAEMEPAAKHAISHRARAFDKFAKYVRAQGAGAERGRYK